MIFMMLEHPARNEPCLEVASSSIVSKPYVFHLLRGEEPGDSVLSRGGESVSHFYDPLMPSATRAAPGLAVCSNQY